MNIFMPYPACTPILPDELTAETDTAVYVLSRQEGEDHVRWVEKGELSAVRCGNGELAHPVRSPAVPFKKEQ